MAAAVTLGSAKSSRKAVTSVIQVNIGMRLMVMPGARSLRMVTTKLSEAAIDEMPSIKIPSAQKSIFAPGVHNTAVAPQSWVRSVNGAEANQPAFGARPNAELDVMKSPSNM